MHLMWRLPSDLGPVIGASVVFELTEEPAVDKLYFWALQASFLDDDGTDLGAAHTGLQWNPRHPGGRAANWGGYPSEHNNWKRNFKGSRNRLPGFDGDPNTRHYNWQSHRPYRLTIERAPEQSGSFFAELLQPRPTGWRATVTDINSGQIQVLRDLYAGGTHLAHLCVWTEWFCSCDDPTTACTWTEFRVMTDDGSGNSTEHEPTEVFVNHPAENCSNVGQRIITQTPELVIEQRMNTTREIPHGTVLPIRLAMDQSGSVLL
jgi:hypothetical protein